MSVLDWIFCLSTWSLIFCSASLKTVCLYVTYETEASKIVGGIFCNSILELVKIVFSSCVDFILQNHLLFQSKLLENSWIIRRSSDILIELNKHTDLETSISCIFLSKSNWMFIVGKEQKKFKNLLIFFLQIKFLYIKKSLNWYVKNLIWDKAYPNPCDGLFKNHTMACSRIIANFQQLIDNFKRIA